MEDSHAYNRLVERVRIRRFADDSPTASPLIQQFREKWPAKQAFSNLDVLFVQHHLGPLVPRIKAMIEDGLEPERCWFVDIPYSTNSQVIEELERLGCPRSQRPSPFNDPLEPYDVAQMSRVDQMVRQPASRRKGRKRP